MGRSGMTAVCSPDWGTLADALARRWRAEPLPPFETETVIVSSPGVGRMVAQQLALSLDTTGAGICAGVDWCTFEQFRRRLDEPAAQATADPWRRRALTFTILKTLPEVISTPGFELVAHHLGQQNDPARPGHWLNTSARFAAMYLSYVQDQPHLLRAWALGDAVTATGEPLPPDAVWQYRLWQALRASTTVPDPITRHDETVARLRTTRLDGRVQVFAPVRASLADLEVLDALGQRNDVQCYLLTPDERADAWFAEAQTELTANMLRLAVHVERPEAPAARQPTVDLHATYGPNRQVEALREVLCGLVQDDPTLEPRDVVVFCPDLTRYAPLIRAAFELSDEPSAHPGNQLRVRLASATMTEPNDVVDLLARLLRLPDGRARASDLIDLCATPPVASTFGFDDADIERIAELCRSAQVRWGIDAAHRTRFNLNIAQNTWVAGIDQLLAGLTMPADGLTWLGPVLPSEAVESSDAELIGKLAEVVSRVRRFAHLTQHPMPIADWADALHECLELFANVSFDDEWLLHRARADLAALTREVGDTDLLISRAELAELVDQTIRTRRGRSNYGNGALLVTHLGDLAGVPHRVVCLLGADEPPPARSGGDALASPADRVHAARRRGRWWHAISAATERVIVIYQHRDERDGSLLPRPVLLTRLLNAITAAGWPVVSQREHPLHAHGADDFDADAPFSFDDKMLRGAIASARPVMHRTMRPVPPMASDELSLDDLVAFVQHPAAHFLSKRAGLALTSDEPDDFAIPIAPTGLARWAVGDRMLRLARAGADLNTVLQAEWRRGSVGPGQLGRELLENTAHYLDDLLAAAAPAQAAPPRDLIVDLPVAGTKVTGLVTACGHTTVEVTFSRTDDKAWVAAWIRLLACSHVGVRQAVVYGSPDWVPDRTPRLTSRVLTAPEPAEAAHLLGELVELYRIGMQAPIPLPRRCAREFAERARRYRRIIPRDETLRWIERSWRFATDAAWHRFYPDAARLLDEPSRNGSESSRFAELAKAVYQPLIEATEVTHHD